MKTVPAHSVTIKDGSYEVLWEAIILGDFTAKMLHRAIDQSKYKTTLDKENAKDILDWCGLPEGDRASTCKRVAGTVVGMVVVKEVTVWTP